MKKATKKSRKQRKNRSKDNKTGEQTGVFIDTNGGLIPNTRMLPLARERRVTLMGMDYQSPAVASPFVSHHYQTNTFNSIDVTNPGNFSIAQVPAWAATVVNAEYYRVIGYSILLEVTNTDVNPVLFCAVHQNTSFTATDVGMRVASSNAVFGFSRTIRAYPADESTLVYRKSFSIPSVVGYGNPLTEDNYKALTTPTDPADLTHFYWSLFGIAGNPAYYYRIRIAWEVIFYDPPTQLQFRNAVVKADPKCENQKDEEKTVTIVVRPSDIKSKT